MSTISYSNYIIDKPPSTRKRNSANIYKTYRLSAGCTQEYASEKLYISVRQLSEYENDRAPVPDGMAAEMAVAYKAPMLAYLHMKQKSAISDYLPDIPADQTPEMATMRLAWALKQIAPVIDELFVVIDGESISVETSKRINAVIAGGLEWLFAKGKGGKEHGENKERTG